MTGSGKYSAPAGKEAVFPPQRYLTRDPPAHQQLKIDQKTFPVQTGKAIIGTVILESKSNDQTITGDRFASSKSIIHASAQHVGSQGLLLFPAGWYYSGEAPASSLYDRISHEIGDVLAETGCNYQICVGVDGLSEQTPIGKFSRDQISVACDKNGITGLARKFYPSNGEKGHVNLAAGPSSEENGYSRFVKSQGKQFFMSVCFDIAATYKLRGFTNPGVDGILNLVHCFYPRGMGPSGSAYFARHKFAGASKEWHCPVYGAASFFVNSMPERWPSGVIWNQGTLATPDWNYGMNPYAPVSSIRVPLDEGHATIRYFEYPEPSEERVQ